MRKTILIPTDFFLPRIDGVAVFLDNLIPHLTKEYNVIVVAPDYPGEFTKTGDYELYRVPLMGFSIADYEPAHSPPKRLLSLIDRADLVFTHELGPIGASFIEHAFRRGKKIISFIHSIEWILVEKSLSNSIFFKGMLSRYMIGKARKHYSKCSALLVPSSAVGEIFSARGIKVTKFVIRLGIDSDKFAPGEREKRKRELGFKSDDFVVGYVGRIAREKSITTLKRAFLALEGHNNKLLIVGQGIKALKKELSGRNVIITGKKDNVVPYLNAMDVFVMPSLTETTCLAALEAMSSGLPVVSTPVGNMKDYVIEKKTGLTFQKGNNSALSIKLNYLREHPEIRKVMGENARSLVLREYAYKKTVSDIMRVLRLYLK